MMRTFLCTLACLSLLGSCGMAAEEKFTAEQLEFFEKQVRPLLIRRCHECHSDRKQEGSLRLDTLAGVLKGGDTGPAIVPGRLDESQLATAIAYDPDGYQMPPSGKLPAAEIEILRKWIEQGAPWPNEEAGSDAVQVEFNLAERARHWSFRPLGDPVVPMVSDPSWCRTPIDRFILSGLTEAGLSPAEEADRRTWIRRASFDVTGLPPTPEDVAEFVADGRPDAHERVVERLLASPHFGERWGRHWLDLVRYAESRGHEFDFDVANAWKYRDYVIRAINDDVPYDRFVVEHVAGDLLRPADSAATERKSRYPARLHPVTEANESMLGTGFWFLGEWVHSPVDIRQEEADRFDNMLDVYGKAFLGLTVACARCHDHKFDPIRSADFYALQGYLQSSSYWHAPFESLPRNRRIAAELSTLERAAQDRVLAVLMEQVRPAAARLPDSLKAAGELIRSGIAAGSAPGSPRPDDDVFADFESGDYEGWTVEGDAFGTGPLTLEMIPPYQERINPIGKFFVNSHRKRDGGQGDAHKGKLTSRPFDIQFDLIEMLVGGGGHVGKTCVNLLIDGQAVLSATGRNDNRMFPVRWDVREWQGRSARIEIVDDETGGWGNIGVDRIVFRKGLALIDHEARERVAQAAKDAGLSPEVVIAWVETLLSAAADPSSPFHVWGKRAATGEAIIPSINADPAAESARTAAVTAPMEVDDGAGWTAETFITESPAFRLRPSGADFEWSLDSRAPVSAVHWNRRPYWRFDPELNAETSGSGNMGEPGAMSSWRQGAVLKTPSFELEGGRIRCLVQGGVNTYVAVDSHRLILGPLHGSLAKQHPAASGWRWIEHHVPGYDGHRAHVEFYPRPGEELAVAMVVQGEHVPDLAQDIPVAPPSAAIGLLESGGRIGVPPGDLDEEVAVLIASMAAAFPKAFGLTAPEVIARIETAADGLIERRRELLAQIRRESQTAPCMLEGDGEDEYVFIRGSWKKPGATVPRRFLEVFAGHDHTAPEAGSGRLELALQMVDPEQTPILPRVIVNRIWQHYFGQGIVPTADDFGHLGQAPSHPELLDWLGRELIRHGWSLKEIHRRILLSATYRLSSDEREPATTKDPLNRLLSRMSVKRLEGEAVRDALLAVSGRLEPTLHGPSVPIHLTSFLEGRGRPGQSGPVDGQGRRSVYMAVRRNFPDPFLQAFDFPNPHSCTGRRNVSNVPAQALAMMNNPLVTEQAGVWAQRLLSELPTATPTERITRLFREAYSRDPRPAELEFGTGFLSAQSMALGVGTDDPRAWTDYCHVLLNLKEFVFIR